MIMLRNLGMSRWASRCWATLTITKFWDGKTKMFWP